MKRIIIHWTAGTNKASALDKNHYHFIVEGDGNIVSGVYKPEDNLSTQTPYAAHTRMTNTGSIGVAFAAMHGAKERPFYAGKYPITEKQVKAVTGLLVDLCEQYNIPVTPQAVLTHAEVQGTLGIKQNGKWDVTWLPGMDQAGNAQAVGNLLRQKIRDARRAPPEKSTHISDKPNPFAAIITAILSLFSKNTQ